MIPFEFELNLTWEYWDTSYPSKFVLRKASINLITKNDPLTKDLQRMRELCTNRSLE